MPPYAPLGMLQEEFYKTVLQGRYFWPEVAPVVHQSKNYYEQGAGKKKEENQIKDNMV